MNEKELLKELKRVEREMLDSAKNLEFERAAQLRDQLKDLKELVFGVAETDKPGAAQIVDKNDPLASAPARKRHA